MPRPLSANHFTYESERAILTKNKVLIIQKTADSSYPLQSLYQKQQGSKSSEALDQITKFDAKNIDIQVLFYLVW